MSKSTMKGELEVGKTYVRKNKPKQLIYVLGVSHYFDDHVVIESANGVFTRVKHLFHYEDWEEKLPEQWIALFWRDELKNTVDSSTVYTSEEAVKLHCPTAFKYVQVT